MWPKIKRFFTDEAEFEAMWAQNANKFRAAMMAIALGIISGYGPFAPITAALGQWGELGSGILLVLTAWVKAGDFTPANVVALAKEIDANKGVKP